MWLVVALMMTMISDETVYALDDGDGGDDLWNVIFDDVGMGNPVVEDDDFFVRCTGKLDNLDM